MATHPPTPTSAGEELTHDVDQTEAAITRLVESSRVLWTEIDKLDQRIQLWRSNSPKPPPEPACPYCRSIDQVIDISRVDDKPGGRFLCDRCFLEFVLWCRNGTGDREAGLGMRSGC